jgi:hypothetical protein
VSICEVERGRCIGCGRTQTEIAEWRDYDEPQRLAIMDRLEREAAAGGWSIDANRGADTLHADITTTTAGTASTTGTTADTAGTITTTNIEH